MQSAEAFAHGNCPSLTILAAANCVELCACSRAIIAMIVIFSILLHSCNMFLPFHDFSCFLRHVELGVRVGLVPSAIGLCVYGGVFCILHLYEVKDLQSASYCTPLLKVVYYPPN